MNRCFIMNTYVCFDLLHAFKLKKVKTRHVIQDVVGRAYESHIPHYSLQNTFVITEFWFSATFLNVFH